MIINVQLQIPGMIGMIEIYNAKFDTSTGKIHRYEQCIETAPDEDENYYMIMPSGTIVPIDYSVENAVYFIVEGD